MPTQSISPQLADFDGYLELRSHENRNLSIALLNGDVVQNSKTSSSGLSARVFHQGCWGFASAPSAAAEVADKVIRSARNNARLLGGKNSQGARTLPANSFSGEFDYSSNQSKMTAQQKIEFIKTIDDYIGQKYPKLMARKLVLRTEDMEKHYRNSLGSSGFSLLPRAMLYVMLTTQNKDGQPVDLMEVVADRGEFENIFIKPEDFYPSIDELVDHLMKKTDAVVAQAGLKEVVLSGELTGMLAHEAVGHTTEADLVRGGSVAGDLLGQNVASDKVSMVDFANSYADELLQVPVHIDDEGVEARDAVLIEQGMLKGFMHNRESAEHFATATTGSARAFTFSDEPLIRMRNTAVLPGNDQLEDMIASVEDGYYLMKTGNGQADSTSEFMFGVSLGYEIKNGKLGRSIQDTTISGVAFDMLKTVDMLSDKMAWNCSGYCGKKQMMPVSTGGPDMKCRVNIGGQ